MNFTHNIVKLDRCCCCSCCCCCCSCCCWICNLFFRLRIYLVPARIAIFFLGFGFILCPQELQGEGDGKDIFMAARVFVSEEAKSSNKVVGEDCWFVVVCCWFVVCWFVVCCFRGLLVCCLRGLLLRGLLLLFVLHNKLWRIEDCCLLFTTNLLNKFC